VQIIVKRLSKRKAVLLKAVESVALIPPFAIDSGQSSPFGTLLALL